VYCVKLCVKLLHINNLEKSHNNNIIISRENREKKAQKQAMKGTSEPAKLEMEKPKKSGDGDDQEACEKFRKFEMRTQIN